MLTVWNKKNENMMLEKHNDLKQRSPNFVAPGTGFVEDSFFTDGWWGGGEVQAVMQMMV